MRQRGWFAPVLYGLWLGLGAVLFGACGGGGGTSTPRGLKQVMYDINVIYLQLQANSRNAAAMPELTTMLGSMEELTRDPLFTGWTARPQFKGDPANFEALRSSLESAARDGQAAAAVSDLDGVRSAWTKASANCIACHKRYQTSY